MLDGDWFDASKISILFYAVLANNEKVVSVLLKSLRNCKTISHKERQRRLMSVTPVTPIHRAGILSRMNVLGLAMSLASPNIVTMLLDEGFDPMLADGTDIDTHTISLLSSIITHQSNHHTSNTGDGNHPFLYATFTNRLDNVKTWLARFPDWDLQMKNKKFGGSALSCATYLGPNRYELMKYLIQKGASLETFTDAGSTVLHSTCSNADADPRVVSMLLEHACIHKNINKGRIARTLKWKLIQLLATAYCWFGSRCLPPVQWHNMAQNKTVSRTDPIDHANTC